MDTIAKRLKAARALRGVSQAQLAQLAGCGQSSIGSIESGRNHNSALLIPLAEALRINPIWLAEGRGHMQGAVVIGEKGATARAEADQPDSPTPNDEGRGAMIQVWDSPDELEPSDGRVWVDQWDYRVSAGDGGVQWEIRQKKALPFTSEFFKAIGTKPANCRLLIVRGDSMEPFLYNRDMVMVDITKTTVRDGGVYAVAFEHEGLVKQIFKQPGGALTLHSFNSRYPDRSVSPQDLDNFVIIGEVKYRSGSGFASN